VSCGAVSAYDDAGAATGVSAASWILVVSFLPFFLGYEGR
jgi:hypothetical protein